MWRAAAAPVVWLLAALLLVVQQAGALLGRVLDVYNEVAIAVGNALLRGGRWLLDRLGPVGRALRSLLAPLWRRAVVLWRWLNVRVLLRMFRPLGRFGRWAVDRLRPVMTRLVARLRRLVAVVEPLVARVHRAVEAVERAAARLAAVWRRLWAPVVSVASRWRHREHTARGA